MVRRHINRVKRAYTRARGIGSNILQNPIMIGVITAAAKNMINGQPPIDFQGIQRRLTQPNAKNPLIYLLLGHFLHSKPLMTVGAFLTVDPPVSEDIDDMFKSYYVVWKRVIQEPSKQKEYSLNRTM